MKPGSRHGYWAAGTKLINRDGAGPSSKHRKQTAAVAVHSSRGRRRRARMTSVAGLSSSGLLVRRDEHGEERRLGLVEVE